MLYLLRLCTIPPLANRWKHISATILYLKIKRKHCKCIEYNILEFESEINTLHGGCYSGQPGIILKSELTLILKLRIV